MVFYFATDHTNSKYCSCFPRDRPIYVVLSLLCMALNRKVLKWVHWISQHIHHTQATAVFVPILHHREILTLWSQNHETCVYLAREQYQAYGFFSCNYTTTVYSSLVGWRACVLLGLVPSTLGTCIAIFICARMVCMYDYSVALSLSRGLRPRTL